LIKVKATRNSLHVRALDDTYGVKLFARRGGTTKLTNVGQGLF
jgi:DNA-binding transcriptional LysR family regulator